MVQGLRVGALERIGGGEFGLEGFEFKFVLKSWGLKFRIAVLMVVLKIGVLCCFGSVQESLKFGNYIWMAVRIIVTFWVP